jgi:hypothetical protein
MRKSQIFEMAENIAQIFEAIKPELSPFTVVVHDRTDYHHRWLKTVKIYGYDGTLVYGQETQGTWNDMADILTASINNLVKEVLHNEKN